MNDNTKKNEEVKLGQNIMIFEPKDFNETVLTHGAQVIIQKNKIKI